MRIAAILALVAATVAALAVVPASQGTSACAVTKRTINGKQAIVFCGPAKATVRVAGRTLRFSRGKCRISRRQVAVQLGTLVQAAPDNGGLPFFSVVLPASSDGAGRSSVSMLFSWRGVPYVVGGGGRGFGFTLTRGRTRGTFSGTGNGGVLVTGSFAC